MKQCLLVVFGLFTGMCAFVMLLASIGAAIREPPQETVLSVSASETCAQGTTETVCFPYNIPNTPLTVRSLALYEGDMLEIDSDAHLVDAAALEVVNNGSREVAVAYILLTLEGEEYHFFGTNIPSDGAILLIEMDGKPYLSSPCTDCTAWVRCADERQLLNNGISVTEADMGTLRVENTSDEVHENVLLYYKNYLPEGELYLGGITYQTYVGTLAPGECIEITPYRYASGYSKIIKAVPH